MEAGVERVVVAGDLRIRVLEEGESGRSVVVLAHGYPDTSAVWDGVVREWGGRFRVVRFDLPGAGGSERPGKRGGYRVERLVEVLAAVVTAVAPGESVHLVGHDWGSLVGWRAVEERPELFASFVSLSGPSLDHVGDWVRRNRRHPVRVVNLLRSSWYIAGFLVPLVPELVWRVRGVRTRLNAQHRELVNGLGLYRANVGRGRRAPGVVGVPVLQIALKRDPFVKEAHLDAAKPFATELTRRPLQASHWAPRTHPEAVARMIGEFVDGTPPRRELVVITGAGSGIGRATALAFAVDGAEVVAVDLDGAAAQRTAREVRGHAYQLDVADGAATRVLAERIKAEHGVPDVVMANAGVVVAGPFLATSEDDWRRVVDVNLWGVVHTLRAFAAQQVERGEGGHLVVTASMASYFPSKALPAYSTTKAAVLMLAECLAEELAPEGIGVTAICPGVVHTDITRSATFAGVDGAAEQEKRDAVTKTYQRRGYGPERVATAVLRAVRQNRVVVPVTPESRIVRYVGRVSPKAVRVLGRLGSPTWRQ
ncbi:SDR family oxidoreductase [Umezawaea sp. Da 62-37]|uniref:SDR family oxidoreductase n=1 Tax=Umezawaea sp. Da 62-37 TaxID=3075927 RepID=UPI0028F6D665|nr:SDR family oxidoreductase [Umezawaea sp. Da 62-37]WNV90178.1 SDR family oxidoreductase [Umezawaea sp. Da 62-37]